MRVELSSLELELSDLEEIRAAMAEGIRSGLAGEGGEIAALPTYLAPPREEAGGEALVVDIGGTHIRAATVKIAPDRTAHPNRGPVVEPLETGWRSEIDFFDRQAEMVLMLEPPPGLPLGYCFSYPARSLPGGGAVHLQWNKELEVPGVIGRDVGDLLREALERKGYSPLRTVVLNDTVAALLAGDLVFRRKRDLADLIGLVVGTGTNMAAYFPAGRLGTKVARDWPEEKPMAVNLESGNFHPPHLTPWDDEIDSRRGDAGRQRLEKAAAGKFLPQIFTYILEGRTAPPYPETREIFLLAEEPRSEAGMIARLLVDRAAALIAAGLAGLIDTLKTKGRIGILVEGGVINSHPEFEARVKRNLAELLEDNPATPNRFQLLRINHANLIGAAAAAV